MPEEPKVTQPIPIPKRKAHRGELWTGGAGANPTRLVGTEEIVEGDRESTDDRNAEE